MTSCDELSRYLMGVIVVLAAILIAQSINNCTKANRVVSRPIYKLQDNDDEDDEDGEDRVV